MHQEGVFGLFFYNRFEGHVLSHRDCDITQEVSQVYFCRWSLPMSSSSLQSRLINMHLHRIRVINCSWLILAQLKEMAAQHWDVMLAHIRCLKLRLNLEKSVLYPTRTIFLGVLWHLATMQQLSPVWVDSILAAMHGISLSQDSSVLKNARTHGSNICRQDCVSQYGL